MPFFIIERICPRSSVKLKIEKPIKVRVSPTTRTTNLPCKNWEVYTVGMREANRLRTAFGLSQDDGTKERIICGCMGHPV